MWAARIRWLCLAIVLLGINILAIWTTWRAAMIPDRSPGGGWRNFHHSTHFYVNGRVETVGINTNTGVVITRTITRQANLEGYIKVWWPVFAGLGFTWLAIWFVLMTDEGQRLFEAIRLPRYSTRGWMLIVAVLGIEGGLIVTTLRDRGIRPERADWGPILLYLALIHTVAFLPVFLALIHRALTTKVR